MIKNVSGKFDCYSFGFFLSFSFQDLRFTETERKSSPTLTISYRGLEALRGVNVENEIIEMAAILYGDIFHETSGGLREKNFGKRENVSRNCVGCY